jgi:SpoVK/Ycf46/Vps4 family AAA+-type ATPase
MAPAGGTTAVANASQIKALVQSHIDGDEGHFLSVAMQVAATEAKVGHEKLAQELRSLVDSAKTRASTKPIPISQPRGELASLLQVSYPKSHFGEMVLSAPVRDKLERLVKEHRHFAKLRGHGLSPRRKILLVGPPGTGKTLTASVLAGELGIPLFLVRLDALITKFMGETASKLRQVFDAVSEVRGVYFFDEFDAIGSQRGLANDVGEIRRVLNSFLQMIEQDSSNSVILAATNHPEILDYALFRRFDDVIEYDLPDAERAIAVLKNKFAGFKLARIKWERLVPRLQGHSYADLSRAAEEAIKDALIHERTVIVEADICKTLDERREIRNRIGAIK